MLNKSKRSRLDSPSQSTSSTQMPAVTNTHPERASDVDKASLEKSAMASLDMSAVPGMMVTSPVRITAGQARQVMSSQDSIVGPVGLTGYQFLEMQRKDSLVSLDPIDWSSSSSREVTEDTFKPRAKQYSESQRQLEYFEYKARFPHLIQSDEEKLRSEIENVLCYEDFRNSKVSDLNFFGCMPGTPALNNYSISCGVSLK